MIALKHISVKVGEKEIITDFSYDFEDNKVYVVMGPNGSGKSTLAYALMGHPTYKIKNDKLNNKNLIFLNGEDISELDAQKRAEKGIFLSFQSPQTLSGITVHQLLQLALSGKKDPLAVRQNIIKVAKELKIPDELLGRSLNNGASGGEKKKLEVLQAAVLDKQIQIFDEVDTGVDVDALKTIATFLHKNKKNKTFIVITHYNRILKYLKPDNVLVLMGGKLVKQGSEKLAEQIEKNGYLDKWLNGVKKQ